MMGYTSKEEMTDVSVISCQASSCFFLSLPLKLVGVSYLSVSNNLFETYPLGLSMSSMFQKLPVDFIKVSSRRI